MEWTYNNPKRGIGPVVVVEFTADGSIYCDWDLIGKLITEPPEEGDLLETAFHIQCRLLLAARGKFPEVTREEADQIAANAYGRSNFHHASFPE
jgi:hypothetical protein